MMAENEVRWEATFIALEPEQKKMLKALARRENRSLSAMIRHLVEQALKYQNRVEAEEI